MLKSEQAYVAHMLDVPAATKQLRLVSWDRLFMLRKLTNLQTFGIDCRFFPIIEQGFVKFLPQGCYLEVELVKGKTRWQSEKWFLVYF